MLSKTVKSGFTLVELMVSIAIMGLIAVVTMNDMRTSQRKDQLNTAARVLAADIRAMQAQALSGKNIKSCPLGVAHTVCEQSASVCSDSAQCIAQPPSAVGLHVTVAGTSYDEFADVDSIDGLKDPNEIIQSRSFPLLGAQNVVIDALTAGGAPVNDADVSFQRQNGTMGINGCYAPVCNAGPFTLIIQLRQTQTNDTKNIVLNAITGRISIE